MYVLYDGNCRTCRRTIACLRMLDVFHRIEFLNACRDESYVRHQLDWLDRDTVMRDMHVVVGRRVRVGYDAYRALAGRIPLLWPLLPLMYLPPVEAVGERVYRRVADSRTCAVPTSPVKRSSSAD